MEKIFIRERINIVNYKNENIGLIYSSSDIDIEGGATNVTIEADVSGWYQLDFDIPSFIFKDGKQVHNPFLKNLFPLAKLQYTRVIREGDKEKELILYFIVQPQNGTRDENGIILQNFSCVDYPRHVLSKAKIGLTIGEDTIDEELSLTPNNEVPEIEGQAYWIKADVQSRTDFNSFDEIVLWGDAKPGAFAYIKSTNQAYRLIGSDVDYYTINADGSKNYSNWFLLNENQTYHMENGEPIPDPVWCPDWEDYPLSPDINNYDYGDIDINDIDEISVQFYWDIIWLNPDKNLGRFDGTLYTEGSRLVYNIYKTYDYEFPENFLGTEYKVETLDSLVASQVEGATAYVIETGTVFQYTNGRWENTHKNKREYFKVKETLAGKWAKLDPQLAYLQPNNAENYLKYILKDTEWKVGTVDKILVDTGTVEMDESGYVTPKQQELRTYLDLDSSNAYNGIIELCSVFKAYPRFDHVNKIVSLKSVPGEDYGLKFFWRNNLNSTTITQDGEKAVSKLWIYGGEDTIGQQVISECNRMNPNYYLADYSSLDDLKNRVQNPKINNYAKVSKAYTWKELTSLVSSSIPEVETLSDLPIEGQLGQMYFVNQENSYWAWFPEGNSWYDTMLDLQPDDENMEITLSERYDWDGNNWISKGQFYHWYENVSPYGDNYIMDFTYFLDRKLITKEQIDDIKNNYILPMSKLNKKRVPLMTRYTQLNDEYLKWSDTYDACKISRDAIGQSLKTTYTIKEQDDSKLWTIKETGVYKFPAGADISTSGWIASNAIYSEVDCPEVDTYEQLKANYPNPTVGQLVKVKENVIVYYWNSPITFEETICSYLGYTKEEVNDPSLRLTTLLENKVGTLIADIRGQGLFEKLREEELYPREGVEPSRPELGPWYNPPANIIDMPEGNITDPTTTSLMHSYYDALNRYVTEQLNMDDALERLDYIENEMKLNLEKQELLLNRVNEINAKLRENYGDFIVEGSFTDDSMVWKYNLWYAGLEALELYHKPLITYELNVTDVSGLPEYRTMTKDIYHDIVYMLNKPELVLPNPGDYCYITDNTLGIVEEKANITSVVRNLSNPSQNKITIDTVDTNTEDLIGKLITAANTIYSKQEIYNRSAVINEDGTIATDSISSTMEENSGNLTLSSANGTVIVGENGITTVDRDNAKNRMQYTGKGIFASTNGGVTWNNIVNAGKISIKNLEAGSIDANTISVSNIGHDASIIIDGKGITALNYTNSVLNPDFGNRIGDQTSFFLDSISGNAYFKGMIQSGSGLIGGWKIEPGKLSSGSGNTFVGLSSSNGEGSNSTYAIWAGSETPEDSKFWVKHDGTLNAAGATIEGAITATSGKFTGEIQAESGKIGGWSISSTSLSSDNVVLRSTSGSTTKAIEFTNGNFYVRNDGYLYSSSGKIGGWNISSNSIKAGNTTLSSNGTVTTSNLTCKGGTIAGWEIRPGYFEAPSDRGVLNSDGTLQLYPQNGGRYVLNSAYFQVNQEHGVQITSNGGTNSGTPSNMNIDIMAENDASIYLASRNTSRSETAAVTIYEEGISLNSKNIRLNCNGLSIGTYGGTRRNGRSVSLYGNDAGGMLVKLTFVNGILVEEQ